MRRNSKNITVIQKYNDFINGFFISLVLFEFTMYNKCAHFNKRGLNYEIDDC